MFEKALRKKYRFPSVKGALTLEQLFDLPLQSKGGFDLDSVAKTINQELRTTSEESFVETSTNPRKGELEDQLEIVRHIIKTRISENAERMNKAARAAQISNLEALLAQKKNESMAAMSAEEIETQLKALRGESA